MSTTQHDVYPVISNDGIITCHVIDNDFDFMFGAAYDPDGTIVAQQVESKGDRMFLDA